jgi:cysteine-rich repeat protein
MIKKNKIIFLLTLLLIILLPSVVALKQGETTTLEIGDNNYAVYFHAGDTVGNLELLLTTLVEVEPLSNAQTIKKEEVSSCYYITLLSETNNLMVTECESLSEISGPGELITIYPYVDQDFCISAMFSDIDGEIILSGLNVPEECLVNAFCGNGIIELNEECDDGNSENEDGCSITCVNEDTTTIKEKGVIIDGNCYMILSEQDVAGVNVEVILVGDEYCSTDSDDANDNNNDNPNNSGPGGSPGGNPSGNSPSNGPGSMAGVPLISSSLVEEISGSGAVVKSTNEPEFEGQNIQQTQKYVKKKVIKQKAKVETPGLIGDSHLGRILLILLLIIVFVLIGVVTSLFVYSYKKKMSIKDVVSKFYHKFTFRLSKKDKIALQSIKSTPVNSIPGLPKSSELQLKKFISFNVRKGLDNNQIIKKLTKAGWKKKDIESIMKKN